MTDVDVVIINRNTEDLLEACIESVHDHANGLAVRLVIVDNGSGDDSVRKVRRVAPDAMVIENADNRGFGRAANQGIRAGDGRAVVILNSDARLTPGALPGLLATLDDDGSIGLLGPQLVHEDGRLQNSVSNAPTVLTELVSRSLLRRLAPRRFPGKERMTTEAPTDAETLVGACMMFRRSALESVGAFDEQFFFFLEETDLCVRLRASGRRVVLDPRERVIHLQGRSARRVLVRARIEYWRSRYAYFRKHARPAARALLRVGLLLRLAGTTVGSALATACTLGLARSPRDRLRVSCAVAAWHLRGCPPHGGLEPRDAAPPGSNAVAPLAPPDGAAVVGPPSSNPASGVSAEEASSSDRGAAPTP